MNGQNGSVGTLGGFFGTVTNSGTGTSTLTVTNSAASTFGGIIADGTGKWP